MLAHNLTTHAHRVESARHNGTTVERQHASRCNGLKGGRPRKYLHEVGRSANAVRQQAYRDRHGLHGDGASRRPRPGLGFVTLSEREL